MTRYAITLYVSACGNPASPRFSALSATSAAEGIVGSLDAILRSMDGEAGEAFLAGCKEAVAELGVDGRKSSAKAVLAGKSVEIGAQSKAESAKGPAQVARSAERAIGQLALLIAAFRKRFDKWLSEARRERRIFQ